MKQVTPQPNLAIHRMAMMALLGMIMLLGASTSTAAPIWTKQVLDSTPEDGATFIQAADFDGDGDQDVLGIVLDLDSAGEKLALYRNDGSGNFTEERQDCNGWQWCKLKPIKVGDLDGDGDPDLLVYDSYTSTLAWWSNNGSGVFTQIPIETISEPPEPGYSYGSSNIQGINFGDIDNDGDIDVQYGVLNFSYNISPFTINYTYKTYWWRNDGGAFLTKITVDQSSDNNFFAAEMTVADMDSDGDDDLVSAPVGASNQLVWYRFDGGTSFTKFTIDTSDTDPVSALRAADMDGDGDTDLVASRTTAGVDAAWWRNDGGGSFSKFTLSGSGGGGEGLDIEDVDLDGDKDILIGNEFGVVWIRNDGGGNFTNVPIDLTFSIADSGSATRAVDVADIDGDGDLDILGAASSGTLGSSSNLQPDGLAWWQQEPPPPLPQIDIVASTSSIAENVSTPGVFTVTRSFDPPPVDTTDPLTVYYSVAGTATNGDDYNTLSGSVTIPAGETSTTIEINPIDDNVYEDTQTVILTINSDAAYTPGIASAAINISSDDGPPVITFSSASSSGLENTSPATFEFTLSHPTEVDSHASFSFSGTADYGGVCSNDYAAYGGNLGMDFGGAGIHPTFNLTICDDGAVEDDETIVFSISNVFPTGSTQLGPIVTHTYTILDNDKPRVKISATDANAAESGLDTGTFTFTRWAGPTTGDLTVNYTVSGTATSDSDYSALSGSVVIPDGSTTAIVTVTPIDDFLIENDETVTVTISTDAAYHIDAPTSATVTLASDDVGGVSVNPTSGLTTTETGGTDTFTVVLDAVPSDNVIIGLSSSDTGEGSVSPTLLTFTQGDWNSAQTVTVTGIDDFSDDGDIAYTIITTAASSVDNNFNGLTVDDVSVTNTDDDSAGITVTPMSGLITDELGETDTFTVVLNTKPTDDVTIDLSSDNTNEGTVTPTSLTFTSTDWDTPQTVTVTGVDDVAVDGDVAYNIVTAAAASGDLNYSGVDADDVAVTNVDNETPGIKVKPTAGLVTTEAGDTATFDVVLYTAPTLDVTIGLSSSDTTEGTVSPSSLTFTNSDYDTPQTVTVTGVDDVDQDPDIAYTIITAAATGGDGDYDGMDASDVSVTNLDNDTPGITITPTSGLTTTEAGGTDTFTVVLDSLPTADITIGLSSSDTTEGTVSPASVTFTPSDWDSPQTVTITGADDPNDDGDVIYTIVTAAATVSNGTDTNYDGLDGDDVTVTNTNDDISGVTVTPTSGLTTTEAGGTDTFTVVLDSEPLVDVTIPLSSSNTDEGTISPSSLTFTTTDWDTPQTVTVTGVDDLIDDGDAAYTAVTVAASAIGDPKYNGFNADDVSVTNTNDDTTGITVTPTSGLTTTEAGGTDTFTVVLDSEPADDVTIGLSSSDTNEGTVSPTSLTFTSANWNSPQTVTVTGIDDVVDDGDAAYSIVTAAASSGDSGYNGYDASDVSVTNSDDDTAGITVTPTTDISTTEAGGTDTFFVYLNSQPTDDVTIGFSSSNIAEGTVSPTSLTITAADWNIPQTITVTGVDDSADDGDVAYTIVTDPATSNDGNYSGKDPSDVSATNLDNDTSAITVITSGTLATTEAGGTASFTVVLGSEPTADVSLDLLSSDTSEGTVSPSSLTFTSTDWDTPQTVTVTGVDDAIADGNISYTIITVAATSGDGGYDGLNASDATVVNIDDDVAGISVSPTSGLTTTEAGGSATFDVILDTQPADNVTIAIFSNDITEGTVSPSLLTFTSGDWNSAQTVTVTGVDDVMIDGDISYTIATSAASSNDSFYDGINPSDVLVTNTDNDTVGITVDPFLGLATTEAGGTATFTVVLDAAPTDDVTIGLSSDDTSEGTVSPASLTFTSSDWDTPQTVTITGVDDVISDGDITYTIITAAASSADGRYDGLDAYDVTVTNEDDDIPGFTITPTFGLTTTEAGGTDTFDVVLNTPPTGDVTFSLASSDTTEGTVSPTSLTFTNGNWNSPRTVTVTGVDDSAVDGNVLYSIITSPASSSDANYNGIDPSDISLTNSDDDVAGPVDPSTGLKTFWETQYNSGDFDEAANVVTDTSGNVYVTGRSYNGSNYDFVTLKYNSDGNELWSKSYDGGDADLPVAVRLDASNNVYVAGQSHNGTDFDFVVVKYNSSGTQQWISTPLDTGRDDAPVAMSVDSGGNVYLTGNACTNAACDYLTQKLTPAGSQTWLAIYDGSSANDEVAGLGVDIAGNIYITGRSRKGGAYDFVTIKYTPGGTQEWVARYDSSGNDYPSALITDAAGNVYIAGHSFTGSPSLTDLRIVKYNSVGVQQWAKSYNGGIQDFVTAMAVDTAGNVYVTGNRGRVDDYDYGTLKINADGSVAWSATYDNGGVDDEPADIAVDGAGRVYVTGTTGSAIAPDPFTPADRDFATVVYDANGVEKRMLLYDAGQNLDDVATSISLGQDSEGLPTVHVTGTVTDSYYKNYVTIKYGTTWPDLTVSSISGPATGLNNGDIVIDNTILNVNDPGSGKNESAAASTVALYLAPDVSSSPDLNNLIPLGTRTASALTTGASDAASTTVTIPGPGTVSAGNYFLVAEADSGAVVAEKDETNNMVASGSTITISDAPDLVPASVSGPAADTAGNNISVSYDIDNTHAVASGSFNLGFVLSTDTVIGNGDDIDMTVVSGGTVSGVLGNNNSSGSTTVTIPNFVASGDYYFGVIADNGDAISEPREDNNTIASTGTITITALPDLTVTAVEGPLGITAGQNIVVTNTIHATDDVGAFDVAIYLSTDSTIDGSDTLLTTRSVSGMSANTFDTDNTVVTIPGGTAQGIYYLGAVADYLDTVTEQFDNNNSLSSSIATNNNGGTFSGGTTTVGDSSGGDDVDLVVTDVSGITTAVRGDPVSVSTTVENVLATASGSFDVGLYLSPDATITTDDIFLGSRSISSLAGGGADTANINGTIPIDLVNDKVKGLWHMNSVDTLTLPPNTVDNGNGTWTTTLQPDGTDGVDTYVQSYAGGGTDTRNTNFGSSTQMRFNYYSSYNSELLLKFDIASLPISSLNSATLSVRTKSTDAGVGTMTYRVGKITSAWDENTATWNNRPSRTGTYASTNVPINAWANWSVTSLVNEWLSGTTNNGFSIYRASSTGVASGSQWYRMGYSSDYTANPAYRPKLVVTYIPYDAATDVSNNANEGEIVGGVSLDASGQFGNAFAFDGSSGAVRVADSGIGLSSPFTLEAWVNPTDTSGTHVIIGKEDSYLLAVKAGTLQYTIMTAGTGSWVDTGLPVSTGSWSHVALVYNGTTVTGYVNGVADSTPDTDPDGGAVTQNSNPICIGNQGTQCDGSSYFNGSIDEVALYNVALSASQISERHTSATEGAAWNSNYYIGAIADSSDAVTELNEANNTAVQTNAFGEPGSVTIRAFNGKSAQQQPSVSNSSGGGVIGWRELLIWIFAILWLRNPTGGKALRLLPLTGMRRRL
jgi:hypothetical protein